MTPTYRIDLYRGGAWVPTDKVQGTRRTAETILNLVARMGRVRLVNNKTGRVVLHRGIVEGKH
jgi:hypothetical protein